MSVFQYGDRVQLTGPKQKMYTITLEPEQVFHSQWGTIQHSDIVGVSEGSLVATAKGTKFLMFKPLLQDFVMAMPRGAAIVYPKDAAAIIGFGDIYPGARVLEAGVGSGALSLSLLRAIGEHGSLHSFELREEFAEIAKNNAITFFGREIANWNIIIGDAAEKITEELETDSIDRVVLDLLKPWELLKSVVSVLRPGGVIVCYVATATQLSRVAEAIRDTESFTEPSASEVMIRGWHVEGLAVRPDHRMVAHTGFLIQARKLAADTKLPPAKYKNKTEFDPEDVEAWTPGALGDRVVSYKRLKKSVQESVNNSNAVASEFE